MSTSRSVLAAAASTALLCGVASAETLDGAYRVMLLCEKMKASPDILHVPLDLVLHGSDATFARPIFNWNGRRVLGSELGSGQIGSDGRIHLPSPGTPRARRRSMAPTAA